MSVVMNQHHANSPFSKPFNTPGDLEGSAPGKGALYLSPNKQNGDLIGAYHHKPSPARRLPMTDAYNHEAQQLADADLDLRMSVNVEKIFGNSLFEGPEQSGPSAGTPRSAGSVIKMNTLFSDGRQPSIVHGSPLMPNTEKGGLASRKSVALSTRASGAMAGSRSMQASAQQQQQQQGQFDEETEVRGFNDVEDEPVGALPVVSTRLQPTFSASITQNYASWEAQVKQLLSTGRREDAVRITAPPGCMVRCCIRRSKKFFSTNSCFELSLESPGSSVPTFLLASRKRKKSKTSSYVLSLSMDEMKRDTPACMAKLKANFVGTEYTLWGRTGDMEIASNSTSTNSTDDESQAKKGYGREELCINFKQTAMSTKGGPRTMYVIVPTPGQDRLSASIGGTGSHMPSSEVLSACLEKARLKDLPPYLERKFCMARTKMPEWDERVKAYTLDFGGRVTEASVKNFQLVSWDPSTDRSGNELLLQFGKQEDDNFALDFTYPFSIEHAFAVALASIDTKLCYTM